MSSSAASTPSLSEQDFQRLQETLLELKTKNYSLEEQCRKQKSALGDAQAKATVLEEELAKAQKVIQRSKKASDVQAATQEKEALRRKLQSQEEEFRLQNQTLLTELSNLVSSNERLEREIESLQAGKPTASSPAPEVPAADDGGNIKSLRQDLLKATQALEVARGENAELRRRLESDALRPKVRDDSPETVRMAQTGSVSFSKSSSRDNSGLAEDGELQQQVERLREERDSSRSELLATQALLSKAQDQLCACTGELEAKSKTLQQVQKDKDGQIEKLNGKISELSQERDRRSGEDEAMSQEVSRLKQQLKSGFDAFNDFKAQKGKEVEELNAKMAAMEQQLSEFPPSRRDQLEAELSGCRQRLEEQSSRLEALTAEAREAADRLREEVAGREEAVKTSEKRKSLLDEMAIAMTNKTEELAQVRAKLQELEAESSREVETLRGRLGEVEARLSEVQSTESDLRTAKEGLEEKLKAKEEELQAQLQKGERTLREAEESHRDMLNVLESEKKLQLRDLNMQLEIANAQRTEFEETCTSLREEVLDLQEERRIVDRKSQQASKDLRRQLQQEKQRNDRLQEKMRDCSFVMPPDVVAGSPGVLAGGAANADLDAEDRRSISSWSLMSGQNDVSSSHSAPHRENKASTPVPMSAHSNTSSPHAAESLPRDSPFTPSRSSGVGDGAAALLEKVASLQDERVVMDEKIRMLEHSAAAMADELLKKTTLINYYCMEGGKSVPQSPVSADKTNLTMKKVMNMLAHPDAETRKEMQRMQNMLEETLTKNMHLQADLQHLSEEVVRLSKVAAVSAANRDEQGK